MTNRLISKFAIWLSIFAFLTTIVYIKSSESVSAATFTLSAVDDAYVYKSSPDSKFGAASSLAVKYDSNETFLKFDISSILETITSAKLRIYGSSTTSLDVAVYGVDTDTWH